MRRARLKRSSAANPFCHCVPVCPSVRLMIMCVTGLFLCLPLTMRPPDEFWVGATSVTATRNSWPSWDVSTPRSPMMGKANFTSSLTTIPPIKPRKSIAGCCVIPAFIFISLPLAVPGSTWSSASLLVSLQRPFDAEASLRCDNFKPLSTPTSPNTTKNPNLLPGLLPQIRSLESLKTPFLKSTSLSGH